MNSRTLGQNRRTCARQKNHVEGIGRKNTDGLVRAPRDRGENLGQLQFVEGGGCGRCERSRQITGSSGFVGRKLQLQGCTAGACRLVVGKSRLFIGLAQPPDLKRKQKLNRRRALRRRGLAIVCDLISIRCGLVLVFVQVSLVLDERLRESGVGFHHHRNFLGRVSRGVGQAALNPLEPGGFARFAAAGTGEMIEHRVFEIVNLVDHRMECELMRRL